MDDKCREALLLTWDLVVRQLKLLGGLLLPATWEIASCLSEQRVPTPEQVRTWEVLQKQVTPAMFELTAAYESVHQAVVPFQLDS